MDVNVGGFNFSTCSSASASGTQSSDVEDDNNNNMAELRRGPWTVEEDLTLINYISNHGEGRWNSLARCAGLKRTGKSCRLRWLNYLRPDVRRGNISLEEQLLILELHSRWGNRWSKIAQHLPGRTDNEIKNYWRTRVQKHAKQLQCDVNSKQFKDTMRYLWMPRLVERIQAAAANTGTATSSSSSSSVNHHLHLLNNNQQQGYKTQELPTSNQLLPAGRGGHINTCFTPENSSTAASSDSLPSDIRDHYTYHQAANFHNGYPTESSAPTLGYFNQGQGHGISIQGGEQSLPQQSHQNMWFGGEDTVENSWNVDDLWFLQQHFCNGD